jgi:transposase
VGDATELQDLVVALQTQLAERDAQLAERDAQLAELEEKLATALAAIDKLTEQANRNSGNSHLPPSSDGPGAASRGVRRSKNKKKSKRKRGGQKGRRGAHRELLPPEEVDEFVDLFPTACEACARELPEVLDVDARRYQQLDLRHSGPHLTEWRRHSVVCSCGHCTRAPYDASKIPSSPFGPGLITKVAALTGVYHLSRRMVQLLLREFFGIDVSLGAISKMEARSSNALAAATTEIHDEVVAAMVKYADETTWLMAGVTMSLWTMSTKAASYFRIFKNGRRKTIKQMFADATGRLIGVLVSDRASVFKFWVMAMRQICWAHLLRKFVSFSERDGPVGTFGRELLDYARVVFEYWQGFLDGTLSREELQTWMAPVQRRFEATLGRAVAAGLDGCSGSCADILAHADALWTFVTVPGVDPTNNLAERDLRALVIWRKLCFGCQSERGLRFVERVMSVAHTLRKRGIDVLDFFERSVVAHLAGEPAPRLAA